MRKLRISDRLTHSLAGETRRVGVIVLIGSVLTAGLLSDAAARGHRRDPKARLITPDVHAEMIAPEPVRPAVMRYYGGPKSPMWRGFQ